jgi:hypothetical protein
VPLNIMGPSGSYVRTDNTTGMAYSGSTAPEQYTAYHAGNTSDRSPVVPGQTALLQSAHTGMWCRLAPLPSNSTQIGMVCDQPTSATAVAFTYTGDGLAVDNVKLVAPGPGQSLLLANTTRAPVNGSTGDDLTLSHATTPTGACLGSMMHPTRQAHCSDAGMQWAATQSQHAAPDTSNMSYNNSPPASICGTGNQQLVVAEAAQDRQTGHTGQPGSSTGSTACACTCTLALTSGVLHGGAAMCST